MYIINLYSNKLLHNVCIYFFTIQITQLKSIISIICIFVCIEYYILKRVHVGQRGTVKNIELHPIKNCLSKQIIYYIKY